MPKGGTRKGAGRKPKPKLPFVPKKDASSVLELLGTKHNDKQLPTEADLWLSMLLSHDEGTRFRALSYLTDRRDGKAMQQVKLDSEVSGTVTHEFDFSKLADEQLAHLQRLVESAYTGSDLG